MMEDIKYLRSMRILYVEDDISARDEVAFLLDTYTDHLFLASDGKEGLKLFKEEKPDLVITDIQMPNMNGIEMAAAIREENPDIPIVVTTAFNDSEYLFKAIELNINVYETKPIDLRRLLTKLVSIAKQRYSDLEKQQMQYLLEEYQKAIEESTYIVYADSRGNILGMNDRLADILGITDEEYLLQHLCRLLTPERDSEGKNLKRQIEDRKEWIGELKYSPGNDSSDKYFKATMIPMKNMTDEKIRFIIFMQDITELISYRKLLQKELQKTKASLDEKIHYLKQYQQIIDEATAICSFKSDGTIEKTDSNFNKTLGAEAGELIGKSFFKLCEGVKEDIIDAVERSIKSGTFVRIESKCKKSSEDKERIANSIFKPIFSLDGTIEEIVSIHQDITELIDLNREIKDTQKEILYRLGEVAENHSKETGQHVRRVAEYSYLMAKLCSLNDEEQEILYATAPMHDIGKLTIPESILHKPGKLTDDEFEIMKTHALKGAEMFSNSDRPFMKAARIVASQHHENYDGTGYPYGMAEEDIHIYGRIVAIADVFDALSVERVYKPAWPMEKILEFMRSERGKKFDPALIDIFFENLDEFLEIRKKYS